MREIGTIVWVLSIPCHICTRIWASESSVLTDCLSVGYLDAFFSSLAPWCLNVNFLLHLLFNGMNRNLFPAWEKNGLDLT